MEDLLVDVEKKVETKYEFLIKDHRLTFHGICKVCQEKGVTLEGHKAVING